jgi:hypothetical protein
VDGNAKQPARRIASAAAGEPSASTSRPVGASERDAPGAVRGASAGAGAHREAGQSPDDRADRGTTPALQVPRLPPRHDPALPPGADARADALEAGRFTDDDADRQGARLPELRAAAAVAPASDRSDPALGPSSAAYVQAWMKATTPAR